MRAVIDTNALLSRLFSRGTPHRLIARVRSGALTLVISPALLAEPGEVLLRPKFQAILARAGTDAATMLAEIGRLAEIVEPPPLNAPVGRDPDDDAVLALAVAAKVDLIISGDRDLLVLGDHPGVPIVDPASAMVRIRG